ncbi:DNA polymerase delta, subunit 4-domain-containing protein [Trametes meyenii]|nr:DNA polymerase delta, subunit 4-domain-containing protein [Trametes meyenii]
MPPRKNSKNEPAMKQAKLSFVSKRHSTASGTAAGKQSKSTTPKKAPSRASSSPAAPEAIVVSSDSESDVSFNDDYVVPAVKKRRLNPPRRAAAKKPDLDESEEATAVVEPEPKRAKLDLADKRWRKQYGIVREQMGNLEPVHAEGQSMVHYILRVFDLSYEYGPCIGVSRIDRWERADALGLNPPPEVKEILMTQEGSSDEQFSQSVFYGEV